MGKKKDEPREIPVKFVDKANENGSENIDAQPPENNSSSSDDGKQAAVDEQPEQGEGTEVSPADGSEHLAPQDLASADLAASDLGAEEDLDSSGLQADLATSELQSQVDALLQERAGLFDQLLRRQAEFENYRKRTERERSDLYQRARADVILELLPVIDNFERALSSLEKSGADAEGLRHGIELIHKQFKDALTKLGLQPIESIGQAFDPHLHEAVTIEQTEDHKENTVIEEFERGYRLGDRLLRPAKVKVASGPER